ncbi:radical SAM protein [Maridesulfovibrio sp.]|uniref:radical SAM protein n=1 Tax=Maridesulfovibrio sp. TaxID=2795000 RepID=UPI0039F0E42B
MDIAKLHAHAQNAFAAENYIEAETAAKRILKESPENYEGLELLSRIALKCGCPEKAVEYFTRLEKSYTPEAELNLLMAGAYEETGKTAEASRLLSKAAEQEPENENIRKQYFQHEYRAANLDIFPYEDFFSEGQRKREPGAIFFHAVNVVWGEEFTALFVDDVMPTQLGKDNIESLNREARSLYIIYTTPEDAPYIKNSAVFKLMLKAIDIRIYYIDFSYMNAENKYEMMVLGHKHALRKGHEAGAHMIFLAPDAVFSESTFRNLYKRTKEGYRAIMIGTMRVTKEEFRPRMRELFFPEDCVEAPIEAREMVDLAIQHIHPDTRNSFINATKANGWPSQFLWKIPGEGVIAHNFHLHPIMINPVVLNEFHGAVDNDCVQSICKSMDEIYIVTDSDEMIGFDLSKLDVRTIQLDTPISAGYIAAWAADKADHLHRKFMEREIRIHNGKRSSQWEKLSSEATDFVNEIKALEQDDQEHYFPETLSDYDLRFPPLKLDSVNFQPITKCNLSCVYCPQHWNKAEGSEMDNSLLRKTVDYIKDNDVIQATVGFYGETLIGKNWKEYCAELLDSGVTMNLCSNFNMELSDEDCRILSRFNHIQLSIDSADPEILKEVRPPANLQRMLLNMHKIRAAAIIQDLPVPDFQWMCTLTDRVVSQLPALVSLAASNNVPQLNCNELAYFDGKKLPVNSIFSLQGKKFAEAINYVEHALQIARKNNIRMSMLPAWKEMVEAKRAVEHAHDEYGVELDLAVKPVQLGNQMHNIQGDAQIYGQRSDIPGPGETRACLFPWNSVYIMPDGSLHSCCIRGDVMANLNNYKNVREAMHTPGYTDLRKQLITGKISDRHCQNCPITYIIPVRELKRRVADMIRASFKK